MLSAPMRQAGNARQSGYRVVRGDDVIILLAVLQQAGFNLVLFQRVKGIALSLELSGHFIGMSFQPFCEELHLLAFR